MPAVLRVLSGCALSRLAPTALSFDKPLCAALDGFTLHAATRAGALDAPGREALLRYVLRPPLAQDRLEMRPDGPARIALKRAYADGTVAVDTDRGPAGGPKCGTERRLTCARGAVYPGSMSEADARARRAAERRRTWSGGVARNFTEMDEVDLEFWMRATPAERIRGLTQLIDEMRWIGGERGPSPRLQRSVGGVRTRGR